MSLEQQISKGIMEAMKAKDTVRLSALRNAKKYIIEAKTAGPEIAELPDADVLKIISKLAKQGTDSAAIFSEQNRPDLASEELAQVAVFQEFLPRQLTPEELTAEVKALIAEVGATSMKEMGKVMGNILDPNTKATAKRKISVTLELIPSADRRTITVQSTAKCSLTPTDPVTTSLYITNAPSTGELLVAEMVPQVPGQLALDGEEQDHPKILKFKRQA